MPRLPAFARDAPPEVATREHACHILRATFPYQIDLPLNDWALLAQQISSEWTHMQQVISPVAAPGLSDRGSNLMDCERERNVMGEVAFDLDEVNRPAWAAPEVVNEYGRLHGCTDKGEAAAIAYLRREMSGLSVLDIGMGAGRTTEMLRDFVGDYVGVDYTEAMVRLCQARFPDLTFMHADARQLSAFEANRFDMVMFSFNGIDSVGMADRLRILAEVQRVLKPGGAFLMSAHNRFGPGCGERPSWRALEWTRNPLRMLRQVRGLLSARFNHRRYRRMNEVHPEWAIMNCAAHHFGIVIMYTSVAEQKRQLAAAGFQTEIVFDNERGMAWQDERPSERVWWFHYIARKLPVAGTLAVAA